MWEHLGMMDRDDYRRGWDWKLEWYNKNGFSVGKNLFTTQEHLNGGLDMRPIENIAAQIRQLL